MKSLLQRALSGAVLVVVMVAMILLGETTLLALALAITGGAMEEFFRLSYPELTGRKRWRHILLPILIGWLVVVAAYVKLWNGFSIELFLLPLVFLLFIVQLYRKNDVSPIRRIGVGLTGILYIALPMALFVALGAVGPEGSPVYNAGLILFYVILIWINDVGAYLIGVRFGKHRLFERLSPKKSWEGFFGGLIFTIAAACLLGPRMTGFENTEVWVWIIFGVVLTLSAVAGDLVESMFKREAGVKDSGNVIPGHGGFLDRFDAMFLSLPFIYVLVKLMA